jgi:DNA-directed RNA polymerase subunit H (RpoH/RPB5)
MNVILYGGPLDGMELELDEMAPEQPIALPDPASPGMMVVYHRTNRMKGRRHVYRIVQGPGC